MTAVRAVSASLVLAALSACTVSLDSQGHAIREERRFEVSGTPELRLTTFDGPIDVRGEERDDILIEIEKRGATQEAAEAIEIVAEREGRRIQIEARRPRGTGGLFDIGVSPRARLIARAPRSCDIVARTGDGAIIIHEITGRIELRTADGSIRGADLGGRVYVQTGDGSVALDGVSGRLDAETGDGSLRITGDLEALRLRTGDGSVRLRAGEESRMVESWDVTTGDGSIVVELPPDFSAELDAHSGDGSVRAEGLTILRLEAPDRRTARGTLGSGGHALRLRTGDGGIVLRQR